MSETVKKGKALIKEIDDLEAGARALKKAADELSAAEGQFPFQPLESDEKAGRVMVTAEELDYVEKYRNAAGTIANEAMKTRVELQKAIYGWEAALRKANENNSYTRQAVWDSIYKLDFRFQKQGGSFLNFLKEARDNAARVESWASSKAYHAAHILGKPTPEWYAPPAP